MPTIAKTLEMQEQLPPCRASRKRIRWYARRRDQEDRAGERAEERDHEGVLLHVGDTAEPLRERDGEQEGEEHLDAGERDPQLVQELDQLAVDPFLACLLRHGRRSLV